MGGQCTAHIKAIVCQHNGQVEVKYCSTHHNHEVKLTYLRIPSQIRVQIASKLLQGISMDRIMDDIRDTIFSKINRQHLISKQDLHNIKTQFNIEGIVKHKNDLMSVSAWVEELKKMDYNSVLAFKNQGEDYHEHITSTTKDDFLLCLQTEFQRDMLKNFGSNAICMDSTHGTNSYDFHLTSILVVDEYGEGIPVGWMISNRQDSLILMEFLKAIKSRTGEINSRWFMSDDAEQFFTAWRATFGDGITRKLLCTWHVDRAWRKALQQHIVEKEKQVEVYHQLRVLLMETEEANFRVMLQDLLTYLKEFYESFYDYFMKNYCNRLQQWASCYRVRSTVNTNMFLEAFHRVLKIVYLYHKKNRRIDSLITVLLKIARDKAFERFRKVEMGKSTHRVCEIRKRHKKAEEMQDNSSHNVTKITSEKWKVESQGNPGTHYIIEKQFNLSEKCMCKLICTECKICIHSFCCTCLDASLHSTICKHVHLVAMNSNMTSNDRMNSNSSQINVAENSVPYFNKLLASATNETSTVSTKKSFLLSMIDDLSSMVAHCEDATALTAAKSHIVTAMTVIKSLPCEKLAVPTKRKIPPNSNNQTQLQFFSTKKQRISLNKTLSKPSSKEILEQKRKLKDLESKVCGVCLKENDSNDHEFVDWIQCVVCTMWIHCACTNHKEIPKEYICHYCT